MAHILLFTVHCSSWGCWVRFDVDVDKSEIDRKIVIISAFYNLYDEIVGELSPLKVIFMLYGTLKTRMKEKGKKMLENLVSEVGKRVQ